jgi:hypothetical protein
VQLPDLRESSHEPLAASDLVQLFHSYFPAVLLSKNRHVFEAVLRSLEDDGGVELVLLADAGLEREHFEQMVATAVQTVSDCQGKVPEVVSVKVRLELDACLPLNCSSCGVGTPGYVRRPTEGRSHQPSSLAGRSKLAGAGDLSACSMCTAKHVAHDPTS